VFHGQLSLVGRLSSWLPVLAFDELAFLSRVRRARKKEREKEREREREREREMMMMMMMMREGDSTCCKV